MFLQHHNISARSAFPPHILRIAKISKQKSKISLKPKIECPQPLRYKRPKLSKKNKGGAPIGNQYALKTGLHTAEMRALNLEVQLILAETKRAVAQARMVATMMDMESRSRLRAAGLASDRSPAVRMSR